MSKPLTKQPALHPLAIRFQTKILVINQNNSSQEAFMPTIFRFLFVCAAFLGICYGIVFLLATLLEPQPREITVVVPPSRYAK
jgi:hypothetical protein